MSTPPKRVSSEVAGQILDEYIYALGALGAAFDPLIKLKARGGSDIRPSVPMGLESEAQELHDQAMGHLHASGELIAQENRRRKGWHANQAQLIQAEISAGRTVTDRLRAMLGERLPTEPSPLVRPAASLHGEIIEELRRLAVLHSSHESRCERVEVVESSEDTGVLRAVLKTYRRPEIALLTMIETTEWHDVEVEEVRVLVSPAEGGVPTRLPHAAAFEHLGHDYDPPMPSPPTLPEPAVAAAFVWGWWSGWASRP